MTVLYIAGPMTGIDDWNFPAFNDAAATLRARGHDVINPAEHEGGNPHAGDWAYYMRQAVRALTEADALVMLPGWRTSRGATLEAHIARQLGLPLHRLCGGELLPLVEMLGLSGYARSGKDTAAELLEEDGWQRASFAGKIREALLAVDPLVGTGFFGGAHRLGGIVQAYGWDKAKDVIPEVRSLLQRMGTEVGRSILGADVWIDLALTGLGDGGRYVFTDVRFPNEADAIVAAGGRVLRIDRPGFAPINDHPSETALDSYPFAARIVNDSSLGDFAHRLFEATR